MRRWSRGVAVAGADLRLAVLNSRRVITLDTAFAFRSLRISLRIHRFTGKDAGGHPKACPDR